MWSPTPTPYPAREAEGLRRPQTQTPAGRHTQTRMQTQAHGVHNRRRTVLRGLREPGAHTRHKRTHPERACTAPGRVGMGGRSAPRGPAHTDTDPDPGGKHPPPPRPAPPRGRRKRGPGRRAPGPAGTNVTGPSGCTHASHRYPPEHLPPSWRLRGSRTRRRGGGRGRGLGVGSGAGSGRPRPPAVRPTAPGLRRRRLRRLICPRPRGGPAPANQGRRRPDERPAAPPPVLQLSSRPQLPQGRRLREGGSRRSPARRKPRDPHNVGAPPRRGHCGRESPGIPLIVGCAARGRAVLWEVDTWCGESPASLRSKAGGPGHLCPQGEGAAADGVGFCSGGGVAEGISGKGDPAMRRGCYRGGRRPETPQSVYSSYPTPWQSHPVRHNCPVHRTLILGTHTGTAPSQPTSA